MAFTKPEDIANRACQHVGVRRIATMSDVSLQAEEINFCYDKLRQAELRRSPWRFASRRAMLRPLTATCFRYIPPAWSGSSTSYAAGNIVQDTSGVYWIAVVAHTSSTSNGPGSVQTGQPNNWQQYFGPVVADVWAAQTGTNAYNAGDVVYKAGRTYYICTANGTTSADPALGAPWVALLAGTDQPLPLLQPAGPGLTVAPPGTPNPASGGRNRTMFPLPYGYLRVLDPDPRIEGLDSKTTTAALGYKDWRFEGGYIITNDAGPLLLRFIADVSDVSAMDALFCEGLGARVGYEICERVTGSNIKKQAIGLAYAKFMQDARLVNQLEVGNSEQMEEEQVELSKGPAGVQETPQQQQAGA